MLFKNVTNIRIRGYLLTGIRIRGSSYTGTLICIRIRGASRAGIHIQIRIRGYANIDIPSISILYCRLDWLVNNTTHYIMKHGNQNT